MPNAVIYNFNKISYLVIIISKWRNNIKKNSNLLNNINLQILNNIIYLNLIYNFKEVIKYKFKKNLFNNK